MFKSLVLALALMLGVGCTTTVNPYTTYDIPEPILSWAEDNVWKIAVGNGMGSGFAIDEEYVVTACHVVRGADHGNPYSIWLTNDRDTRVIFMRIITCNTDTDVAVLKKTGGDDLLSTFEGFHPKPKVGKGLWGAGHGLGGPLEITAGHAGRVIAGQRSDVGTYFGSMLTVPGDSGSPVIALYNGQPLVVGIRLAVSIIRLSWTQITLGQHMTYIAPYKNIQAELDTAYQLVAIQELNAEITGE